jgi:hypothetical protein
LEENESKAARERLKLVRLYEELRGLGFEGSYAAVRRYTIAWRDKRVSATADAFVPLTFAPGEACWPVSPGPPGGGRSPPKPVSVGRIHCYQGKEQGISPILPYLRKNAATKCA